MPAKLRGALAGLRRCSVGVRVRMSMRMAMNDPSLRSAAADDATQEHGSSVAADAVIVTRDVAGDPVPHDETLVEQAAVAMSRSQG